MFPVNPERTTAPAGGMPTAFNRRKLQTVVFLVVLPVLNMLFLATLLINLDIWETEVAVEGFVRLWLTFGLSLAVLRLVERYAPAVLEDDVFWRQLLVHAVVIVGVGLLTGPIIKIPASLPRPTVAVMPRVFLLLELATYLGVVRVLNHQESVFAIAASLRDAELNILRAQSNPHFLFNTLNLIAAEISRDPENAKEVVFDLADLLRSNVKMAEKRLTTVSEEMNLVDLFLKLQQQRFRERLTFSMKIDPATKNLEIPALLLQPVVENTVKWGVAPHPGKAHIEVVSSVSEGQLSVVFADTGPSFDDANIVEGDGFRILRRTLELNYPGEWSLSLRSTDAGGRLSVSLPARAGTRV